MHAILQSAASGSKKRKIDDIVEWYTDSESDGELEVIFYSIYLVVILFAFSFCYEWMFKNVKMLNLIYVNVVCVRRFG